MRVAHIGATNLKNNYYFIFTIGKENDNKLKHTDYESFSKLGH